MGSKIRAHIRQQIVGYVSLFLVISGGTAYAAHLVVDSSDVVDESLRGIDVRGQNATASSAGVNGTLTGADIGGQPALPGVGQPATPGTLTGADVADNRLTGADVDEATLNLGQFSAVAAAQGSCNADFGPETCAELEITLDRPGQVLLQAAGSWGTNGFDDLSGADAGADDPDLVIGSCSMRVDGTPVGASQRSFGEKRTSEGATPAHPYPGVPDAFGLNAVTAELPTGTYTVDVRCQEGDGNIDFFEVSLTAAQVES